MANPFASLKFNSDIIVAMSVVFVIMMLIIPLPTVILDTLMAFNITLSLLVVLIVLYTKNAMEFSVFPTILLLSTVFGLALNVSSTRLILAKGSEFDGRIIRAFSRFVVSTDGPEGLVIGFIIFVILIAVQFIVITKGTTRVAEVAARFTLDSLPGKQMSIDAEFNSGTLTADEVAKKRVELEREVDFYGAMDGASKFVSGNVKVGILITVVNILGGIIVGTTIHSESINIALTTYVALSIGDGLVSQMPSLLISTAAGLIVTRAISDGSFGQDVGRQFSGESKIYWIAAVFLALMGFLPGFPWYVLLPLAGLSGYTAYSLGGKPKTKEQDETEEKQQQQPEEAAVAPPDPLALEIGSALVLHVHEAWGSELLDRIKNLRRQTALEFGLVFPKVRIVDNMNLQTNEYCIKIWGTEIAGGQTRVGSYLAINPGNVINPSNVKQEIQGEPTVDPAYGFPALWISEDQRAAAEAAKYTVVDSISMIVTHLGNIVRTRAPELLGREEVQNMLDVLKKEKFNAVVEEVQKQFSLGEVQKVLQGLLREQVSIRNIVTIFETMADYAAINKDPLFLVEKVRQSLARQICLQHAKDKTLKVITLDPYMERNIIEYRYATHSKVNVGLPPEEYRKVMPAMKKAVKQVKKQGEFPVLLCSEEGRPMIKNLLTPEIPDITVMSVMEIVSEITVEAIARVEETEEEKVEHEIST